MTGADCNLGDVVKDTITGRLVLQTHAQVVAELRRIGYTITEP